jgi:hypothetical protein
VTEGSSTPRIGYATTPTRGYDLTRISIFQVD